jgi:hypothetical protein
MNRRVLTAPSVRPSAPKGLLAAREKDLWKTKKITGIMFDEPLTRLQVAAFCGGSTMPIDSSLEKRCV